MRLMRLMRKLTQLRANGAGRASGGTPEELRLDRSRRSSLPLGAGVHVCPCGPAALAVAECAWRHVTRHVTRHVIKHAGADGLQALARGVTWRATVNASIPLLA